MKDLREADMNHTLNELWSRLRSIHGDDRGGERDTLTTLLILALIIVPLIALIITFSGQIEDAAKSAWTSILGVALL